MRLASTWAIGVFLFESLLTAASQVPTLAELDARTKQAIAAHAWQDAESMIQTALSRVPESTPDSVELWNRLGEVHQQQQRFDDAEHDYQHAIDLNNRLTPSDTLERSASLNNLASLATRRGRAEEAEALFRRSLDALEAGHQIRTRTAVAVLDNVGVLLEKQGRYDAAREMFERALQTDRDLGQENTPAHAKVLVGLGLLDFHTGDYPSAIKRDKIALAIQRKFASAIDPSERAVTENNLGVVLFQVGNYAEAEPLLQDAAAVYKSNPSHIDPRVIDTLNTLALLQGKAGQLTEAASSADQVLQVANKLGSGAAVLANTHNTMGTIARERGEIDVAKAEYETASKLWLQSKRATTPEYATTLSNMGALYSAARQHRRAEDAFRQALRIDETALGPNHPKVAFDLENLAAQMFARKQWDQALEMYLRAKDIEEKAFGPASLEMAQTWRRIGATYQSAHHLNEAEQAYSNAIAEFKALSSNSPEYASALHNYAALMRRKQKFADAEEAEVLATRVEVRNAIGSGGQDGEPNCSDKNCTYR